jgi:hypothetical protein
MSARKGKNGFVRERIVSSPRPQRNIQDGNESDFNEAKMRRAQARKSFVLPQRNRRPSENGIPRPYHVVVWMCDKRSALGMGATEYA